MDTQNLAPHHSTRQTSTVIRAALLAVALAGGLSAQEGDSDIGEVSAYTGIAFGALGTHFTAGGSIGVSLDRYTVVLLEGSYVNLGEDTLVPRPGFAARSSGLGDFDIALHVRVPVRKRWEPYFLFAPAELYNAYQLASLQPGANLVYVKGQNDWKFAFQTGPGLRYYLFEKWGVRAEYRYTISTRNFSRLLFGVFRQF
jgi:opacity protein-like surface antigen